MSRHPDPRTHAYRGDIADIALAGQVFAPHYAEPVRRIVSGNSIMLRSSPGWTCPAVSQLVRGEAFDLLDRSGEWAWGRCGHDGYVGYVPVEALAAPAPLTHRIHAIGAPVFEAPDIKTAVLHVWPIGALFAGEEEGAFLRTEHGFVHRRHALPIDAAESDPVAVAARLLGQPYIWGGRGAGGVDCSGLVQTALAACGIAAPRDSDMQRETLGEPIADDAPLQRGDLIFFPGHVGLMHDERLLLHANAHHMAVTIEPLGDVVARITAETPVLARRRLI